MQSEKIPNRDSTPRLSESASRRLAGINRATGSVKFLRVAVLGGGCSGFSYEITLADRPDPEDMIVERDGQSMLIDPASLPFLEDAVVDHVEELVGSRFVIDNPNAVSSCGCGTSFSIAF